LREAALMGKIYKNAACNIAAPDASSGQQGCLYPRNSRTIQPEPINYGSENEEYLVNETDIYDDHVLYSRAWVLQEAILARRTLDCGRGQLFWRCSEMSPRSFRGACQPISTMMTTRRPSSRPSPLITTKS
jgi:hypothetical protein